MLCNQWQAIRQAYATQMAPCLIHQEGDVITRSIRDNLRKVQEIIIDDHVSYVKARKYLELVDPSSLPILKLYNNPIPLFNLYQIESQIETAYQREVLLPSGGALVIDRTEALVAIDINSAKATSGSDIEATALNTNLEAADEIARQLRLRDLGGLVVIDFIDMNAGKNQREVENRLKEALKADRARIQVGRISRFGLLEMSRQRLRLSLGESALEICSHCEGRGTVRNIQSHGLSIIRLIEEEATKEKTAEVHVQLPVDMATFIMNEKRTAILDIEKRHHVSVLVIANPYLQAPKYNIMRLKEDNVGKSKKPSYTLIQELEPLLTRSNDSVSTPVEPAVKFLTMGSSPKASTHFLKRVWKALFHCAHSSSTSAQDDKTALAIKHDSAKTAERRHHSQQRRRRPTSPSTNTNPNQVAGHNTANASSPARTQSNTHNPQRRRHPNASTTQRTISGSVRPDVAKKKTPSSPNSSESNE